MEEILSSIKRIIAEDKAVDTGETAVRSETSAKPKPTLKAVPKVDPVEVVAEVNQNDEVLELTDELPEEKVSAPDETHAQKEMSAQGVFGDRRKKERLIDDDKLNAMRRSLSQLTSADEATSPSPVSPARETSLEELTRDLMRPMLKDWLDQHLPALVEELVAKEIRRLNEQ